MPDISIVQGQPEDFSDRIAALFWSAGPSLNAYLFGADEFRLRLLRREWEVADGWLGHASTRVALAEGEIIGLVTCHAASDLARRLEDALRRWRTEYGAAEAQRLTERMAVLGQLFPALPPDGYYVLELAVDPAWQGQGLGRRLLETAEGEARAGGFARLHLDVEASKPAVAFYKRCGLRVAIETRLPELESSHGVGLHCHMVKDLD